METFINLEKFKEIFINLILIFHDKDNTTIKILKNFFKIMQMMIL
jgi:hypothetical protein